MRARAAATALVATAALVACRRAEPRARPIDAASSEAALRRASPDEVLDGRAPIVIPAQCYVKTRDASGRVHNPCYTCHSASQPPNATDDASLQLAYEFSSVDRANPHAAMLDPLPPAELSDDALLAYVRGSNYPPRPSVTTGGYVPDAAYVFDERGFDRRGDAYTGWRAYAYYPTPGMFLPTNGSMGDALVRLPEAYRQDEDGAFDRDTYEVNLAIVEALVRRRDVQVPLTDEARFGVDLDGDGALGRARVVRFVWPPAAGRTMSWVGRARLLHAEGRAPLAAGLFPLGTELLHSVRYLDVRGDNVTIAARMKELRYARKASWMTYADLELRAQEEQREKQKASERARVVRGDGERGVWNGLGWRVQAFIEDAAGELRPQTFRETALCAGCHGSLGATTDGTFSFARRLGPETFQGGWFHPTQRSLEGVPDPQRADGRREYALYLETNGAGDDFRTNDEVARRFFDPSGRLVHSEARALRADITRLLLPSPSRALALDRAYLAIVRAQSFERGRDALLAATREVWREVPDGEPTGVVTAMTRSSLSSREERTQR